MVAIISVVLTTILGIMVSYNLYCNGYKKLGIKIFRGILQADILYVSLVLLIGMVPMH